MNNFKSFVPAALQAKIKALCTLAIDKVNRIGECVIACEKTGPIEGNYVSGWLPRQDGGFSVNSCISSDEGYEICQSQRDWNNTQYQDCLRTFCQENDVDTDTIDWLDDSNGSVKDRFYDYQYEWNQEQEPLVQFQCFCELESEGPCYSVGSGRSLQDIVTIRLSVNFKDAPYYREKYATDLWQEILSVEEFMAMDNQAIIDSIKIDSTK